MVLITVEGLRGKEKDHDGPEQEFHQDLPLGCQLSTLFSKIEEEGFAAPYALRCPKTSIHRDSQYGDRTMFSLPPPSTELVVVEDKPSDFDAGQINVDDTFIHFSSLEKTPPALDVELDELNDSTRLVVDDDLEIAFHRTLRMPDDNRLHQLPQSLGYFPLYNVKAFSSRLPDRIVDRGGVFFPMWQREAMWIEFHNHDRQRKYAIRINVGKVNAVSGLRITEVSTKQDYIVVPDQPWLDGIAIGPGAVRQFVAMPLGKGYTVEGQVTGEEKFGGLQIEVVPSYEGFDQKRFARKSKTDWETLAQRRTPRSYHLRHGDRLSMTTPDAPPKWRLHQIRDFFDQLIPEEDMTHVTLQAKYSEVQARSQYDIKRGGKPRTIAHYHSMMGATPVGSAASSAAGQPQQQTTEQGVQTWGEAKSVPKGSSSYSSSQAQPPTPEPQHYGHYPVPQSQYPAYPSQGYSQSPTSPPQAPPAGYASPPPAPQQPGLPPQPQYLGYWPEQRGYQDLVPTGSGYVTGEQQPAGSGSMLAGQQLPYKPEPATYEPAAYGSPAAQQPPPSSAPYQSSQAYAYANPPPVARYHAQPASGASYKNSGIEISSYDTAYGRPEPAAPSFQPYHPSGSAPQETSSQEVHELPSQGVSTELPSLGNELEQSPSQSPRSEEVFDYMLGDAFEPPPPPTPPTQLLEPYSGLYGSIDPVSQPQHPEHQPRSASNNESGQWEPQASSQVSSIKYTTSFSRQISGIPKTELQELASYKPKSEHYSSISAAAGQKEAVINKGAPPAVVISNSADQADSQEQVNQEGTSGSGLVSLKSGKKPISRGKVQEPVTFPEIVPGCFPDTFQASSGSPQELNALEAFGTNSKSEDAQLKTGMEEEGFSWITRTSKLADVYEEDEEQKEERGEAYKAMELEKMKAEAYKAEKAVDERVEERTLDSIREKEQEEFLATVREAVRAIEMDAPAGTSEITVKEVEARNLRERDAEERARKAEEVAASAGASKLGPIVVEARGPRGRKEAVVESRMFRSREEKKEEQPEPPKPTDPQIQSLREMGLAAGGKLIQDIYEDWNPPWIWNTSRSRMLNIHIFDSWTFEAITHIMAPPTPITAEHYTQLGLPFFVIEEEMDQRIDGGDALKGVKSVSAMDKKVGLGGEKPQDAAMNKVEPGICKGCSIRLTDCIIRPCNHQLCHACIKQAYTTPVSTNTTTGTTTSSSTTNPSTTNLTPSSSSASDEEIILIGPNFVPQRQTRTHSQPQQQGQGQLNPSAATFRPQSRVDTTPKCPTCFQKIIRVAGFSAPMNIPGEEAFKVDVPVHLLRVGGDGRVAFQSVLQNRL